MKSKFGLLSTLAMLLGVIIKIIDDIEMNKTIRTEVSKEVKRQLTIKHKL